MDELSLEATEDARQRPSDQFTNRTAKGKHGNGAAAEVQETLPVVDAQVPVDCGPQVVGAHRAIDRLFSLGIGGTDHLSRVPAGDRRADRLTEAA